ncbi:ABC-F family ATP-binding cassette domain-containing protein [Vulgatibacter sp.]|uniref:ABC-F family ATP-binding cassette domain-containing protein n=1 Tax=Vulgatibacter sp. TaxID=1971226 RepID=UPI003562BD1C
MSLLHLEDATLSFAGEPVLAGISLRIDERTRLGLVGRNGAGKSTLLRILGGELAPDKGRIQRRRDLSVGWLKQIDENQAGTVLESALEPFSDLQALEAELRSLEPKLADGDPALLEHYGHLHEQWERRGAYVAEAQAKKILSGLGFAQDAFEKPVCGLSGGERTRLGLARLLLGAPDVLLLDEPTNHLDLGATEFLEELLRGYKGAAVVSSHDRSFLDATVDRVGEIARARLTLYTGNYSAYLEQRAQVREQQQEAHERQQALIARTEEFIRRNIAGQATKQAQARRKMLEKLDRVEAVQTEKVARLRLDVAGQSELEVAAAEDLALEAGGRRLFEGATFTIRRGERVGIVGPNGVGKSTLLKALLGKLRPAAGFVRLGGKVSVGYHDQELSAVDPRNSVLEELHQARRALPDSALRSHAGRFLFSGDEAERPIGTFSGGERARACLAKLTLAGFNLLVLDEPTNHLDAEAREALETALDDYAGTLVCVSHDRWFLERTCERLLWLDAPGGGPAHLEDWSGSFFEVKERREAMAAAALAPTPAADEAPSDGRSEHERRKAEANAKKAAERRAKGIDEELARLEKQVAGFEARLQDPNLAADYVQLGTLQAEKDGLEERMLALMEERESLPL